MRYETHRHTKEIGAASVSGHGAAGQGDVRCRGRRDARCHLWCRIPMEKEVSTRRAGRFREEQARENEIASKAQDLARPLAADRPDRPAYVEGFHGSCWLLHPWRGRRSNLGDNLCHVLCDPRGWCGTRFVRRALPYIRQRHAEIGLVRPLPENPSIDLKCLLGPCLPRKVG